MDNEKLKLLAERFCQAPLPETVCADLCASTQQKGRTGTNLLSVAEAEKVLAHVLDGFDVTARTNEPSGDGGLVAIDYSNPANLPETKTRTCQCKPYRRYICPGCREPTSADARTEALREALQQADNAIREMFRYYDGGETRGSYDGRPERRELRAAGDVARRTLALIEKGAGA